MEIAEFVEETARIENFFEKELTKFQRDEWFKELKNMTINRYRQLVNQAFRQCKFMPKLADIVSINMEMPYNSNNNIIREKVECSICNGDGIIKYFKQIDNGDKKLIYEYYARCNCENGKDFVYDGTTISDTKHRTKFYIPSMAQINLQK